MKLTRDILEQRSVVFFDLETNGLDRSSAILELGAVRFEPGALLTPELGEGEVFHSLVYFDGIVNEGAFAVNNLSPFQLRAEGVKLVDVLTRFSSYAHGAVFAGQNIISFDLPILNYHGAPLGFTYSSECAIDTKCLAQKHLRLPSHRLSYLSSYFNVPHRPTHRALDDVWATVHVLRGMLSL